MAPLAVDSPADAAPGPVGLRRLEGAMVVVAAICVVAIGALITVGIFTRALFGWSPSDTLVIVRELMIGATVLPLAYVAAEGSHISVEVFTNAMPERAQPWISLLGSIAGFLVLLPITYGGYAPLAEVIEDGAYFFGDLELPEWPGRLAFFIGFLVFAVRMLVFIARDANRLRRRSRGPGSTRPRRRS